MLIHTEQWIIDIAVINLLIHCCSYVDSKLTQAYLIQFSSKPYRLKKKAREGKIVEFLEIMAKNSKFHLSL